MLDLAVGVAQAAVGLCFAYAAVAKFIWFRDFQQSVASFGLLREGFVRPAGIVFIALEAAVGLSFLGGGVLPWALPARCCCWRLSVSSSAPQGVAESQWRATVSGPEARMPHPPKRCGVCCCWVPE